MLHRLAAAMLCGVGLLATDAAADTVDLELVLLADASGSIDDGEIRFQRQGYAEALTHPEVLAAIASGFTQRIAVTYVEWGDFTSQEIVVPWRIVDGAASAKAFADELLSVPRRARPVPRVRAGYAPLCGHRRPRCLCVRTRRLQRRSPRRSTTAGCERAGRCERCRAGRWRVRNGRRSPRRQGGSLRRSAGARPR